MDELQRKIVECMNAVAAMVGCKLCDGLCGETVLLESGLDSLGFAILVARLEEDLGYDPFTLMAEPVYPRTLGEFVEIYRKYCPGK